MTITHPTSSKMDTLEITPREIGLWRVPPFQRPVRTNAKVMAMAAALKANGGVIDGVITLGSVAKDSATYIVDGQHRLEAGRISGLGKMYADVRICEFENISHMADEFVRLNSSLARMRPDDVLRGCEPSMPLLAGIRKDCPFVGYDQIRRNHKTSPIVSMSALLRCWGSSANETPAPSGNLSAQEQAQALTLESAEELIRFMTTAHNAWGRDPEYWRLYGNLNLTLCMWLYRRLVVDRDRKGNKRYVLLNLKEFRAGLTALSADENYCEWLVGRTGAEINRNPCYTRIKTAFAKRLRADGVDKVIKFPSPAWAN